MADEKMDGALINAAAGAGARGIVIAGAATATSQRRLVNALAAQAEEGHRLRARLAIVTGVSAGT